MNLLNLFIAIHLILKQYKLQFKFFFLFWFVGFLFFLIIEPEYNLDEIILFSITANIPSDARDFGQLYAVVWLILLEVIFFGFIVGELFEKYNLVITSRILASQKRNHAVVVGYHHLSERNIEYCVKNKELICLIEDNEELVEDLINAGHLIVIGITKKYGLSKSRKRKNLFN